MGVTFKENCPDIRNSKSLDLFKFLKDKECHVDVTDPIASESEVMKLTGLKLKKELISSEYDAIILAVAHNEYRELGFDAVKNLGKDDVIYDVKNIFRNKTSNYKQMNITIVNAHSWQNKGDAALVITAIDFAKTISPNAKVTIVSDTPEIDTDKYGQYLVIGTGMNSSGRFNKIKRIISLARMLFKIIFSKVSIFDNYVKEENDDLNKIFKTLLNLIMFSAVVVWIFQPL